LLINSKQLIKGIHHVDRYEFHFKSKTTKAKRCERCGQYSPKSLDECIHCSVLTNSELARFKAEHQEKLQHNSTFGKYLLLAAGFIALLLLLSYL
jgi:hypothetical protein